MTKEVLKLALEALYENTHYSMLGDPITYQDERNDDTITAINEALAQPEQEPTKEMIDAAERIDWADSDVRGNIVNMWQAMFAAAPAQQEPEYCDPSSIIYKVARIIMSDCGHSPNDQLLLDRIADRINRHIDAVTPPAAQRTWVGLTPEQRNKIWRDVVKWGDPSHDDVDLMKAIEDKLKENNT